MRFTFDLRQTIPLHGILGGAALLFVLQLLTGTELFFAELILLFVVLAGLTVNILGGLRTVAGLSVAMIALKVVIISQVAKVLFAEPADHNLQQPLLTGGVLVVGMASILAAALAVTQIPVHRTLFRANVELPYLRCVAWIAFAVFLISSPGYLLMGTGDGYIQIGGVSGLMKRLMPCGGIAVIAGTAYTILASTGKRCLSRLNVPPILLMFLLGVYGASKESMIAPFVYLALTAAAFRFQVRMSHLAGVLAFALVVQFILFPCGQVARSRIRGYSVVDTLVELRSFAADHLSSWKGLQSLYQRSEEALEEGIENYYFDRPIGSLERLSLIKSCDALVSATLQLGETKWETIMPGFQSLLPAAIFRKPYKNTSNYLGIRSGIISEENEGTSISFGFIADAFSSFGWPGVVVIPFLLCVLLFTVLRFTVEPMSGNIWWALFCGLHHHQVAEYNISGIFVLTTYQHLWYIGPALLVHFAARLVMHLNSRRSSPLSPPLSNGMYTTNRAPSIS